MFTKVIEDCASFGGGGGEHELGAEILGAGEIIEINFEEAFEGVERAALAVLGGLGGGCIMKIEMVIEQIEEIRATGLMICEAIRIGKNTAADHQTVDLGVFGPDGFGVSFVADVAVENQLGARGELVAEL